jgi:hypothetical protein
MRCRRAQAHIALWVGDDLEEPTLSRLREHLDGCPKCREHAQGMRSALDVLGSRPDMAAEGADFASDESLWPGLSRQLPKLARGTSPPAEFNGWYPALAVAAVCLLIVTSAREVPTQPTAPRASMETGPVWPVGMISPERVRPPVHFDPHGGRPFRATEPGAEEPGTGWEELTRPAPEVPAPFDFQQNGTQFRGGLRGPADPMMIYAGER